MENLISFGIFSVFAYLIGSVPTAVWVGRAWYNMDVREHGSKNAGATNTFRVLGKKPGIVVLTIDILKGWVAVSLPSLLSWYNPEISNEQIVNVQVVTAICAILGHMFPLFAGFKGGKGVATSLGIVVGLHPLAAGICIILFLVVFIISQFVSLGAICAAIAFPIAIRLLPGFDSETLFIFSVILSLAVIAAHRKNIGRLFKGNENKMNLFKK